MLRFKRPKAQEEVPPTPVVEKSEIKETTRLTANISYLEDGEEDGEEDVAADSKKVYDDESAPNDDSDWEVDFIPELNIAYGLLEPARTPPEIKVNSGEIYFPIVKLRIPLYREPEYVLLSACTPLLFLNLISMGIYVLDPVKAYGDRLACIITILLALFAFMPTYREQITVATITVMDAALFISILVLFLIMMDSVIGTFLLDIGDISRVVLSGVSAVLIFGIASYIVIKYISYTWRKPMLDKFIGGGSIATSPEFNASKWRVACMRIPTKPNKPDVKGLLSSGN